MISHTAYFGDSTYTFTLTDTIIEELQHKTGLGIGALYQRMAATMFHASDIEHVIRLGLIGGGTNPEEAQRLVDTYAKDRPFQETVPLTLDILDARWNGKPDPAIWTNGEPETIEPAVWTNTQDDLRQAAATGDMAAAINDALKQVAV